MSLSSIQCARCFEYLCSTCNYLIFWRLRDHTSTIDCRHYTGIAFRTTLRCTATANAVPEWHIDLNRIRYGSIHSETVDENMLRGTGG